MKLFMSVNPMTGTICMCSFRKFCNSISGAGTEGLAFSVFKRRVHEYHSQVFITERDIDRSSVYVQTSKGVTPILFFQPTKAGARRYTHLTALVAHEEKRKKADI